jgi:GNAT superfamily N-acetyltransferase
MDTIRPMASADLPLGMRLSGQAGWNQTEADWRRFLALEPDGCFVAERDARPVGTVTTCVFDSLAWIAMVLVDKAERGRGIGTRLVEFALGHLDGRGVRSIRLDATALGRPIYEKLGFVAEYELARMEGPAWQVDRAIAVEPVSDELLGEVVELDSRAGGTDRRRLIEQLHREAPDRLLAFRDGGRAAGYVATRDGAKATFIGPAVARSERIGRDLLDAAVSRVAGQPIFIDVPLDNAATVDWARSDRLAVQRRFTRMCRGEPVGGQPELIWASSGPEKG